MSAVFDYIPEPDAFASFDEWASAMRQLNDFVELPPEGTGLDDYAAQLQDTLFVGDLYEIPLATPGQDWREWANSLRSTMQ